MPGGKRLALLAMLVVGGWSASGAERGGTERDGAPRGELALKVAMVAGHAAARAVARVAPLAWDPALAAEAQTYAGEIARTGRFQHAVQPRGVAVEGENLWTGQRGTYRYDEMVALWIAERRDFVNEPTPGFSRTGRWSDVGHYTQVIWRTTTRFGCGMASDAGADYLVCRYAPAGNVIGQRAL